SERADSLQGQCDRDVSLDWRTQAGDLDLCEAILRLQGERLAGRFEGLGRLSRGCLGARERQERAVGPWIEPRVQAQHLTGSSRLTAAKQSHSRGVEITLVHDAAPRQFLQSLTQGERLLLPLLPENGQDLPGGRCPAHDAIEQM